MILHVLNSYEMREFLKMRKKIIRNIIRESPQVKAILFRGCKFTNSLLFSLRSAVQFKPEKNNQFGPSMNCCRINNLQNGTLKATLCIADVLRCSEVLFCLWEYILYGHSDRALEPWPFIININGH